MRGNHLFLGRQDYIEPEPLSSEDLVLIARCSITPRHPDRTKALHHHVVELNGVQLGYVATRLGGQVFKTAEAEEWNHAASDWNQADPQHAQAILRLLGAHGMLTTSRRIEGGAMGTNLNEMLAYVAGKDGVNTDDIEWFSWPHAFATTAGPHGGIGGCVITQFQVFAFNSGINRYKCCAGVWRHWDGEFMGRW